MKYQIHVDTGNASNLFSTGSSLVYKSNNNPFSSSILFEIKHKNVQTIALKSAEIPIGFYNIRSPYNTFNISGTTYTVPPGNYNVNSLITALNTAQSIGIFALLNYKITFTSSLYSMALPFTFTNMSATGGTGPSSITYGTSTPGYGTGYVMTLSNGIQYWTVPASKTWSFTVAGAGSNAPNSADSIKTAYGIVLTDTYSLSSGQVIAILVGQSGLVGTGSTSTSGSGGTFVCIYSGGTYTPIFVAGGAAGLGNQSGTNLNVNGSTGTSGRLPSSSLVGQTAGTNGNGATGCTSTGGAGGAGGGFFTSGTKGTEVALPGFGFLQGGGGGQGNTGGGGAYGGFGGGAGGGSASGRRG